MITCWSLLFEFYRAATIALRNRSLAAPPNYLKIRGHSFRDAQVRLPRWTWHRVKGQLHKAGLRKIYRKLVTQPDTSRPYVFLALHVQPERATIPLGGAFSDQLLIVDLLSKALPTGWRLLVKEHPWQLQPYSRGEMARDPGFYRRIASYDNVALVPMAYPTSALIDDAKAVATITGSVGWQAICRGTPALVFGAAWYRDCEGSHVIEDLRKAKAILGKVSSGSLSIDQTRVRAFLGAVEQVACPGYLEPDIEVTSLSEDEAVEGMSNALARAEQDNLPRAAAL